MKIENPWNEIFTHQSIVGKSDAELCAIGLVAWGNCQCGNTPPKNFGNVMVKIASKLGISPTPDSFMEASEKYIPKKNRNETPRP